MRKTFLWSAIAFLAIFAMACTPSYQSVPNDALNARIYTLDNGLKVYMTVNKDEPRIQTYIAVRVGGKNDPAETTGLSHYLEHLMFKGTKQFGTVNYEAEEPMLNQIEDLFEIYRTKTDEAERKAIYHQIDSISYEASKYFIPNEYDKLMAAIGSSGTNAYTSQDMTVYTEDIPSNQIENWAKIQADRFENLVIRGFHTELETVYEEKNRSLTNDSRKVNEKVFSMLFPHHPYGKQTVLGTQDHLKNPSITNIKNHFQTYYVPNNMAICLSGDFDPDKTIRIIKKYFSSMQPNNSIPALEVADEEIVNTPIVEEVLGNDAEQVTIAWRFPSINSAEYDKLSLLDMIVCNGQAGLFDLNLSQQQKVLGATSNIYEFGDYCAFVATGMPQEGQTLDQVKDLMLEQIEKIKNGDFDEYLLKAGINQFKLAQMQDLQKNSSRANMFVESFIYGIPWSEEVARLDNMSNISKEDMVQFANQWLTEGYSLIYKHQGPDPNEKKIAKPQITPLVTNRDTASLFLKEIQQSKVEPIEPVFLDFDKDLTQFKANSDIPVLYVQNTDNDLFHLTYRFEMGTNTNKLMNIAFSYLSYLGTSEYTPEEIQKMFYEMACSFSLSAGGEITSIHLSGLNENMPQALALLEKLLSDPQIDQTVFDNMITDLQKARVDAKLYQRRVLNCLNYYSVYGPKSTMTNIPSTKELTQLKPEDLIDIIKSMTSYKHRVLYFGPASQEELVKELSASHIVPETLKELPAAQEFPRLITDKNEIYFTHYDTKQLFILSSSNRGELYDAQIEPLRTLYNEYFSGGMNAIVFQEMREARGLAYSADAGYLAPTKGGLPYNFYTQIGTQTDKLKEAMGTFDQIINDMPESETAFQLAKDGLEARIRSNRIIRENIIQTYLSAERIGTYTDSRRLLFEQLPSMTLADIKAFQEKWIKGRTYHYCVLGDEKDVDFSFLKTYGEIHRLSLEEIFGY